MKPHALLAPLTNRAEGGNGFLLPSDGLFHLAPLGDFPVLVEVDKDGRNAFGTKSDRVIQRIDEKAVAAMANSFKGELLVDFEHFSHDPDKTTEAAGWIQNLHTKPEGLFMACRWSDAGEGALTGGRYRYISPVWRPEDCEQIGVANDGKTPIVRPLRLSDAGLTNNPNLRGLSPLSNRAGTTGAATPNQTKPDKTAVDYKSQLITLLGLPQDATDEQIAQAVTACAAKLTAGEKAAQTETELNAVKSDLAESDMDRIGITDADARKEAKGLLMTNRKGALALFGNRALTPAPQLRTPLTNRDHARTPGSLPGDEAAKRAEEVRAAKISNRARQLMDSTKLGVAAAYRAAEDELNEQELAAGK